MPSPRSPPPLQHPRPQHPPTQLPSTSPPPPADYGQEYQRFSSPPVPYAPPASAYANTPFSQVPQQPQQPPWNDSPYSFPGMNDATTQMGVQFGKHAFDAGQAYLDKNFTRLLPLAHLKHSFNLDNSYVLVKLKLILFPWRHRNWTRSLQRSEISGQAEGYKSPREDINCPDLYIPVMALTTYILLAAVIAGFQGQFDPSILGQTASKAFGLLFLEFICIKLGCYLLGIGEEGTVVDLVAYEGYKFVGIIVTLVGGLLGAKGWLYWAIFLYVFLANFFFLLRSLRHLVIPDPAFSPLDNAQATTASSSISHAQRNHRVWFLFGIAASQAVSMMIFVW